MSHVLEMSSKGYRTLTETFQELAKRRPHKIYASTPKTQNIADGFRDFSVLDVSKGTDAFAYWLASRWGPTQDHETIAFMGVSDLRYSIVFYGAIKCGYKVRIVQDLI